MALRPCGICNRTYRGAAAHVYPTLVTGNDSYSNHLRLCPVDTKILLESWASNEMCAQEGMFDDAVRPNCPVCELEVPAGNVSQFFATTYDKPDHREDWWAPIHDECGSAIRQSLSLSLRV